MSDTYRIKPLEWDRIGEVGPEFWAAGNPFGTARVFQSSLDGSFRWLIDGRLADAIPCDSIEDGKAQAEACYRERLLTALDPART